VSKKHGTLDVLLQLGKFGKYDPIHKILSPHDSRWNPHSGMWKNCLLLLLSSYASGATLYSVRYDTIEEFNVDSKAEYTAW